MLRQGTCKKERNFPVTPPVAASNTGIENQYLRPVDSTQTGSDLSAVAEDSMQNRSTDFAAKPGQAKVLNGGRAAGGAGLRPLVC